MKTFILLFVWFVVELVLWITTVVLVVTHNPDEPDYIKSRNNKYLTYVKTIAYIISILFSMGVGYLLNF